MSEWVTDVLSRPAIRIDDDIDASTLEAELGERLTALLSSHMLEPTADGWRDLALTLAMTHEPLFALETPADRASLGGRPTSGSNFVLRSLMKQEMRAIEATGIKRGAQRAAANRVAKRMGVAVGTANNALSRKTVKSDTSRRAP